MRNLVVRVFAALILLSGGLVPLSAQTTGSIRGVVETSHSALPGVTVEAKSPNLQGSRIAVTDAEGRFVLTLLPPGKYTVSATLDGFAPRSETVQLALTQAASITIELIPAKTEAVTVTAEAAAVETDSTVVGRNLDAKTFEALPTGRNYSSVVQLASGVGTDNSDSRNTAITVYGATGLENTYNVDGSNTTGVEYGGQGKTLNFEFIQEVEFKAGGYDAEYGGALGGIINVVTKSGGNEFHGDAFGYFNSDALQASSKHQDVVSPQGIPTGFTKEDFGADVGGYILKDTLWFFGAYDRVDNTQKTRVTQGPVAGLQTQLDTTSNLYSGKLTWHLNDSNTVIGTVFGDPTDDVGAVADPIGPPSTYLGTNAVGGTDWAARYQGILSAKFLLQAQIGQHHESNNLLPGPNGDQIRYEDNTTDVVTADGGFGNNGQWETKTFKRTDAVLGANYYWGNHDIKGGFGYEKVSADVERRFSGGQLVQIGNPLDSDPLQRPLYTHIFFASQDSTVDNPVSAPLVATPNHEIFSGYLQDTWKVLPNLTVNAGVRYEQQLLKGLGNVTYINVNHFSPRVGFSWDFLNNGKSRFYGSYGQFVQAIPLDMNIRSLNGERDATFYNFSPTSLNCDPAAETEDAFCRIAGTAVNDIDPNLKSEYQMEGIVGVEYQVLPSTVVGVRGIYRSLQRVIEDTCHPYDTCDNYAFVNPGSSVLAPELPFAKRYFKGIEVTIQKSLSDRWQVYASYLYSHLTGNFDGSFREIGGFNAKDPNITDDFDYPAFVVNSYGLLTIDRPNQAKVQVAYMFPFNLNLAVTGYYASGTPLSQVGWYDNYGGPELFLAPRGTIGRSPAVYEMNAQLDYALMFNPVTIHILADLFNILNKQQTTQVDQVYAFSQADNSLPEATNAQYLSPTAFQQARTLRLGVRVSF